MNTDKTLSENETTPSCLGAVSGSLYPTDEEILKMVEDFTKDLNVINATKRGVEFGYQEGIYKMIDIWKKSNNDH